MEPDEAKREFLRVLGRPWLGEEIFDGIADTVFFIKDETGRYVAVNQALVKRCGRSNKRELIGKTAREVFPAPLGESFSEQDAEVIRTGKPIQAQLEMHLYPDGNRGWCLTWKEPVADASGRTVGVSGISRDVLKGGDAPTPDLGVVAEVLEYIDRNLDQPLRVQDLAKKSGLSGYQLDQRLRALFDVSAAQYITGKRIELACHLLERSDESLISIALDCGYGDQSAFTRQFRRSVGIPPGAFREQVNRRR